MRYVLILLFAVFAISACSKPKPMTIEEKILTNAFAGYVSASTYDRICNNAKLFANKDLKTNPALVLYIGNAQLLAGRLGVLWHLRHPDGTVEQGVAQLTAVEKKIDAKVEAELKEKGCDSEAGKKARNMYVIYTKTHPAQMTEMLNKTIEKQGGTVTPPEPVK